jgi:gas vesicle protein
MRNLSFLIFVVITFCCWGLYGPILHVGQEVMGGGGGQKSLLRPFICVGVAYFLIAVLYPVFVLGLKGESGHWSVGGILWSFIAGAVGAIGALGIILAFKFDGSPAYVMPLVFGCAPIVNTMVTMGMSKTFKQASSLFYIGILIVAIGAAGVLIFKPKPAADKHASENSMDHALLITELKSGHVSLAVQDEQEKSADNVEAANDSADETTAETQPAGEATIEDTKEITNKLKDGLGLNAGESSPVKGGPFWVIICVALTAICWGAYGPVLHSGQAKMGGSRLRPFLCVGLAYFAIAVVVPMFLLNAIPDPGGWNHPIGILWSLGAGAAGAIGALGIIYAFNFGGKPLFVMPLVFGFAPVINTMSSIVTNNLYGQISPWFYGSLALVILGAVIVLVCAPRKAKPAPAATPQPKTES